MTIKGIGFDLGETLMYNNDIKLSWSKYYKKALKNGFHAINKKMDDERFEEFVEIFEKYNTRTNPREKEIKSNVIFNEIRKICKINISETIILEDTFFSFFQKDFKIYKDVEKVLAEIKQYKIKTGILTDSPYGRTQGFLAENIKGIYENIDIILSSVEIGYRKPNITGYLRLANALKIKPLEMLYVGNEEKDIVGANKAGISSILINRTGRKLNYGETYQFKNLIDMWHYLREQNVV